MTVSNMVQVLKIIKEFCASIAHEGCQNCPLYVKGFGCGVNVCGGPQEWPLERILEGIGEKWKDYDFKTTSAKNLESGHFSLFNGIHKHDVIPPIPNHRHEVPNHRHEDIPNHRHEDSTQDMIHHPGHYNFRGMECKDFIEKFVSDPKSYYEGNIFKYLYRYLEKNKEEDLNKAMEYTRLLKEYLYGKKD